jgi:transcriptional regulator with XRE-family HTH domain
MDLNQSERKRLGIQLRDLRKSKGLNQIEVGEKLGCSRVSVGKLERGQGNYSINSLLGYAKLLECKVDLTSLKTGL